MPSTARIRDIEIGGVLTIGGKKSPCHSVYTNSLSCDTSCDLAVSISMKTPSIRVFHSPPPGQWRWNLSSNVLKRNVTSMVGNLGVDADYRHALILLRTYTDYRWYVSSYRLRSRTQRKRMWDAESRRVRLERADITVAGGGTHTIVLGS
jgi:hypothetical protein